MTVFVRPQRHDGSFQDWEQSLANFAMSELANAGTRYTVISIHPVTGKPCLLFSSGGKENVLVVALYDVQPTISFKTVARGRYDLLIEDWKDHCHAFVAAEFFVKPQPHFVCLNSAATVQAVNELAKHWCTEFPSLERLDSATSSSLVLSCAKCAITQKIAATAK